MTREEAVIALNAIKKVYDDDPEVGHPLADNVLCSLLRSLGYDDVVEAWQSIYKWWA